MNSPRVKTNSWRKLQTALRKIDIQIPALSTVVISLVGLALMSALTVRDFLPLLKEYRYNNRDTNVQVILLDPNFTVPQFSLALPHYKLYPFFLTHQIFPEESDCFYKIAANLKSGDIPSNSTMLADLLEEYRNETVNQFYNALSLNLVEMILTESKDLNDVLRDFPPTCRDFKPCPKSFWKKLLEKSRETNGSIVDSELPPSQSVVNIQDDVLPYPLFLASFNFFIHQSRSDYYFEAAEWGSEKLDALHSKLMKSPAHKLETLFTKVLKSLCQQIMYVEKEFAHEFESGVVANRTCENVFLNSNRMVSFDYEGIWFTIEEGDHFPRVREFKFSCYLQEPSIWFSSSNEQKGGLLMAEGDRRFIAYADASAQYLSVLDQAQASYVYQTPPIHWGNDTHGRKITIKYGVQTRARKTRVKNEMHDLCFDESSVAQCRLICTKSKLIDGPCGCVPFSFRRGLNYSNSVLFCDAETYMGCGVSESWAATMGACLKMCQDSCDYTSYSFQVGFEQFVSKPNVREFVLKTIPVFNAFTEFTWTKKTTGEQFFAQLAGIANLYLGFSGLSMIAGLAWMIEWMIGRWARKCEEKEDDKEKRRKRWKAPNWERDNGQELIETRIKGLMEQFTKEMKTELKTAWKRDLDDAIAQIWHHLDVPISVDLDCQQL